ncbi:cytochrome P450 [Mycolicibacterium sediminis]|uniref:Uncharacterized protein n=1 Tax=Mycolicibacterium sediminis TaxID=1286180 RepID=A0A7I7QT51_9MYCO|nr:cytochrome P450 [Mycolicibacterium sediminis]BBY29579.1 hypothetical protein MSEDJ_36750 [Mycolicibacterium sediminis]
MSTATLIRSEPLADEYSRRCVTALRADVLGALRRPNAAMTDIGARSPMRLVCATLGVPRRDWARLSRLAWQADAPSTDALSAYVDVMIADRCWQPADDLLADLVMADVRGDGLTADEIRSIAVALLTS